MKTVFAELRRAFRSRLFVFSLLITCTLAMWYAWERIPFCMMYNELMGQQEKVYNDFYQVSYTNWLCGPSFYTSQKTFFWLLPLLAALPFSGSFYEDLNGGYVKNILVRTEKKAYFLAKYIATFLSSAVATAIPLLLSFLVTAMFLPSMKPEGNFFFTNVYEGSRWSALFFSRPLIHVFLTVLLISCVTGLVACLSLPITFVAARSFLCYLFPFFVYLFWTLCAMLTGNLDFSLMELNDISSYFTTPTIRVAMLGGLFLASFVPYFITGVKKDVL